MNTKKYLLTATQIEQMEGNEITHFLNPNATRLNKSLGDVMGMQHLGFHMVSVEAGKEATEYHKHHYEEEAIYVLSGTATLILENDTYPIAKGDFIGLPSNQVAHTIINDSNHTLTCLVVGQRLKHDIGDYPNQAKRLYRDDGNLNLVDFKDISLPVTNRLKQQPKPADIITFWYSDEIKKGWFNATPALDFKIREQFEITWELATTGQFDHWKETPEGCLALIILLDQLPLNMYRNQAKSFQTEQQAVAVSKHAIQQHFDKRLETSQLTFLYMPLMHSENKNDQTLSIEKFEQKGLENNLRFARHHQGIIQQYGRFPHRNTILGRESTDEEIKYLNSKQAFKG